MRYRTKILIALVLLAVICGGTVMALFYYRAHELLHEEIQNRALTAVLNGALVIDGDAHRAATTDPEGAAFGELEAKLRTVRDANRREDHFVQYLYTIVPTDDGGWQFVLDAEEDPEFKSLPGDVMEYEGGGDAVLSIESAAVENEFSTDEFGTWLSAYAPIRDDAGNPVALLGADLKAERVSARLGYLLSIGWLALGVAVVAALLLAFLVSRWATGPLSRIERAVHAIGEGRLETRLEVKGRDEFAALGEAVNQMAAALRDRENLKQALTRYVSQDVADRIITENSMPDLNGQRRAITVMSIDIRNFSGLADRLSPEDVVGFLNAYFGEIIEIVFTHRGTLDKFLGDGVMAVFGAPLPDPDHAWNALQAGLDALQRVNEIAVEFEKEHALPLRIGVGLHSGEAIVGNIGSEQRMEYTAIGQTVNLAFRMESQCKVFGVPLIMSSSVYHAVKDRIPSKSLGDGIVNGKPMEVFTLQKFEPRKEQASDIPASSH